MAGFIAESSLGQVEPLNNFSAKTPRGTESLLLPERLPCPPALGRPSGEVHSLPWPSLHRSRPPWGGQVQIRVPRLVTVPAGTTISSSS